MTTGRSSSASRRHWRLHPLALSLACIGVGSAWAQIVPTGSSLASGTATVGTPIALGNGGLSLGITQSSTRAILNWTTFSIGAKDQVNVVQPSTASVLLNRVTGGQASTIAGRLSSSLADSPGSVGGSVYLINPSGIVFANGSSVSTGGLVASTLDIAGPDQATRNAAFMAGGTLTFTRDDATSAAVTVQQGASINVSGGGTVALMGQTVSNEGSINVAQGSVGLLSGLSATLDVAGDGLTTFKVSSAATAALVANLGQITADGGRVNLAALSSDPAALVVNQQGVIQARSLESRSGTIVLSGGSSEVRVAGTLDASGTAAHVAGGSVAMGGGNLRIEGAGIDASGTTGGSILGLGLGGVMVSPESSFKADGSTAKGGTVVLLGRSSLHADGNFSATGATDGGVVVTGGKSVEIAQGTVVNAAGGSGANGNWLVQSTNDLTVTGGDIAYQPAGYVDANATSRVGDAALGRALSRGTDVALTSNAAVIDSGTGAGVSFAEGAQIIKTAGPQTTLQVNSRTNIAMNSGSAIQSPAGPLNVNFNADAQGTALPEQQVIHQIGDADLRSGTISLQGATIESGGGDIRFYGQSDAENGRAVSFGNAPGVQVQDSRIATCALGSDCSGVGGAISLRGEGGTTRVGDVNAFSGVGVSIGASGLETGTGAITIDGRGGLGSAGVSIFATEGGASTLRTASGDIGITGSSRSWLATDSSLLPIGSPDGLGSAVGAGTGVSVVGTDIAAGGNVTIKGTGGDLSRILDEPARLATLAGGGAEFAAGQGVVLSDSDISAGRGRTLEVSGTAGSRGYSFSLDGSENAVVTPDIFDAFGVAVFNASGRGLRAESGTVRITGNNSDVALYRVAPDDVVGADGPSRLVSTASATGPGGTIEIRGRNVLVDGEDGGVARLDSSGAGQAGTVSVRAIADAANPDSGVVVLGENTLLEASGVGSGNGGRIEAIGDTSLLAYGTLRARGGAAGGNGGAIETSAPTFQMAGIRVDAAAPAGQAGQWLIDPYDIDIVNGSASGSFTGNPFVPLANATIQDGDINAALNGGTDVTITTGTGGSALDGNIFFNNAQISYTGSGERTFTLNANRSIRSNTGTTIASSGTGGPLNVVFNADANNSGPAVGGGQISYSGSIYTNGGDVTMNAAWSNTSNQASVVLDGPAIDTRRGNQAAGAGYTGGSDALAGGNVSITGRTNVASPFIGYDGVVIDDTRISTSTGNIDILGTTINGSGVVIRADLGLAGLFTTTGNISVTGVGGYSASSAFSPGYGVVIAASPFNTVGQPRISSVDGNITVRGLRQAGQGTGAGVRVGGNAQITTTGRGDIEITGETQGNGAGVELAATFTDTFGTQQAAVVSGGRNVVLRAANNGSTDALAIGAGSQARAAAVMNLRPGGIDLAGTPDAYVATAVDRTANAITIGGTSATGFAVSADELTRISAPTLVFGSNAHAADITVAGALDTASALTLQNGGGGNIALTAAVTAPTLGLLSAGNITQTAAAPITAGTLAARSTGGSVLLDQAANNVSAATLGGGAAGAFRYQDVDALRIGSVSVTGFDAAGNLPQVVSTGSMAADTVYVRTLSGDLTLATDVSSTSGADLIAAARFQNAGAYTIAGAPWRVWADTWVGETRGGLAGSGTLPNLYHCAYLGLCTVSIPPGDNHFIYAQQPVATVVINDATRYYGALNPLFTYSITGLILGDRGLGFSGTTSTTANAFSRPGFYPINGSFTSAEGYLVNVVPGSLRVSAVVSPPPPDVLRDVPNTYTFDRNIGAPPICFATGPLGGDRAQQGDDLLAREWSRVRSRPNLTSCIDTERKNGCADF